MPDISRTPPSPQSLENADIHEIMLALAKVFVDSTEKIENIRSAHGNMGALLEELIKKIQDI